MNSANNEVDITGFNAGAGWDATTGLGSPRADNLVNFLTKFTSDNDGNQVVNETGQPDNGHHGNHRMNH